MASSSTFFPLDALPDDILVEIFACVAEAQPREHNALVDLHNIRAVSRKFRSLAYQTKVLSRAALDDERCQWDEDLWYPILHSNDFDLYELQYHKFLVLCVAANNPQAEDAVFQLGALQFFASGGEVHISREERGLNNMQFAVDRGVEGAAEVYGVFLLTLGRVERAYQILAPFRIELTQDAVDNLLDRWSNYSIRYWWRPWEQRMEYIRNNYRRGNCQCDGLTNVRLLHRSWIHWPELPPPMTMSCEVCQWHNIIYKTFNLDIWRPFDV